MKLWGWTKHLFSKTELPTHLQRGALGERAARSYLQQAGLKFLTANFRSKRGEIDLVFRDRDCLVFVESKRVRRRTGFVPPRRSMRANAGCFRNAAWII